MDGRTGQARLMLSAIATRHRSRAAILMGGLLAVAAIASVASSSVRAEGFFEAFQSMFGARPAAPIYAARPSVNRLTYAQTPIKRWHAAARRASTQARARQTASRQGAPHQVGASQQVSASHQVGGARQALCVRLCDGYAFPLDASHRHANLETQEASCAATCPGAETALYVGAHGPEDIASATAARGGRSYNSLPTALAYTKAVSKTCVCGTPTNNRGDLMAVLRDMTLRRGDAIMTSTGFRIFAGLRDSVHNPKDFHPLARSPEIGSRMRGTLHKLEVASLAATPRDTFVAVDAPPQRLSAVRVPGFQALN